MHANGAPAPVVSAPQKSFRLSYLSLVFFAILFLLPFSVANAWVPTVLTATPGACGTGTINIAWNSEESDGATGYSLRDGGTVIYAAPSGSTISYSHTGLAAGSSHVYSIAGTNSSGTSEYHGPTYATAPSACSVPAIPTNLTATPGACGTGTINVSWNSSSGANSYTLMDNATSSGEMVFENGAPAGNSSNVSLLLYYNNNVYQEDAKCQWWSWNGVKWFSTSNPDSGGTPACTPSGSGSSSGSGGSSTTTPVVVYDNKVENGLDGSGYSWGGTYNFSNTSPVYSGADSISATYSSSYGGLFFGGGNVSLAGEDTLDFAIDGGVDSGQEIVAMLSTSGGDGAFNQIGGYCSAGQIPANSWTECKIPLSLLLPQPVNYTMTGIRFQDQNSGQTFPAMYYDHISFEDLISSSIPESPGAGVSASGTMIPSANQIVDSAHNVWTVGVSAGSSTSYSGAGLVPGSSHSYSVTATNSAGTSAYSGSVSKAAPSACLPDLTPTSPGDTVASPSSSITTGQSMSFSASVSNSGNSTASNFPNVFQVVDSSKSTTIARITTGTITSLSAGASSPVTGSYTFNTAGTYYVRVCANMNTSGATVISELDTSNNCGNWLTLTISPPAPSCPTLTVNGSSNPVTVDTGSAVTLNWSCNNAASCTAVPNSDGFSTGGSSATSGSDSSVNPSWTSGSQQYGMTCGGSSFLFPAITVVTPTVSISANPTRVAQASNASTTVSWTSSNVQNCSVTKNGASWISGPGNANTTITIPQVPITTQTTFTITCTTPQGNLPPSSVMVDISPNFLEF